MLKGVFAHRPEITDWSHISGISAGALIGSQISQIEQGDRSGFITSVESLMNSHVEFVKPWNVFGMISSIASAFIWHDSLFKGRMQKVIEQNWAEKHRTLYVGAYNQTKGSYESFGPSPPSCAVAASASVPVVFSPVKMNEMEYCDGGVAHVLPIREIETHWQKMEGNLDVMLCYPTDHGEFQKASNYMSKYKLVGRLMTSLNECLWYNLNRDLDDLERIVGCRVREGGTFKVGDRCVRVYVPKKGMYCDFVKRNHHTLRLMQAHGEEIAKSLLSTP
jgi:hypothetical protein